MSNPIYNDAIMRRAKEETGKGRLAGPHASATIDNPLCGDRVTIDLRMEGDRLSAIGHEVRGCILCEAAAATIAACFPGKSKAEIDAGCAALAGLVNEGAPLGKDWTMLGLFEPVHKVRSRRNCVLLPFRALQKALEAN
jgi:nitrogen fixation NifU-like protein